MAKNNDLASTNLSENIDDKLLDLTQSMVDTSNVELTEPSDVIDLFKQIATVSVQRKRLLNARATLDAYDLSQLMTKTFSVVYERDSQSAYAVIYYLYDPIRKVYTNSVDYLSQLLSSVISLTNTDDIDKLTNKVHKLLTKHMLTKSDVLLNPNPKHIIQFNNGHYDVKKHKFYTFDKSPYCDLWHFTKMIPWDYRKSNSFKSTDEKAMYEIVKRVFDDWSGGDSDKLTLILQIIQTTMRGDGLKRAIVLKSGGGDGKSTFMSILRNLVGQYATISMNFHDLSDSNFVNQITSSTAVIIGDDLSTRFSMVDKYLSTFKSIVAQNQLQVGRKYLGNITVQSTAVYVQATNTQVNFYENSPAIMDRLVILNWTNHNFRQNPVTAFNLDELVGLTSKPNQLFYECVISYTLENTGYFESYHTWDSLVQETERMVSDADIIDRFIDYLYDTDLIYSYIIPKSVAYALFKAFERKNAGSGERGMTERMFTIRFNEAMTKKHNFKSSVDTRIYYSKLTYLDIDKSLVKKLTDIDDSNSFERQRYLFCDANKISQDDIDDTVKRLDDFSIDESFDDLGYKDRMILKYLAKHQQNSQALSIVGDN